MASGGRISVTVDLNANGLRQGVGQATRSLRKFEQQGTKSMRGVDRATNKLERSFKSAARSAVGAVAAYVSISQAKVAIDNTIDLYKATSNLTNNLGMATEQASAFAAVAQSRGISVTQLGMAFKTLSTQVEQAKDGTASSVGVFKDLGISMKDVKNKGVGELLVEVSKGLQGMGAGSERVAAAGKLLGRGWQPLLPLLREGPKAFRDNLKYAKEVGATFDDVGFKKVGGLRDSMLKLKLAQMGLQKQFTLALAPAIEYAAGKMTDFAKIINDPKLTTQQKFSRIGTEIEKAINQINWGKVGDALANGISMIAPALTTIASKVTPPLTEAFVKATPAILIGIGKGLLSSAGALFAVFRDIGAGGANAVGRGIADKVLGAIKGPIQAMDNKFGVGFKTIISNAKTTGSLIGRAFRSAANVVKSVGSTIARAMSSAFGRIKSGVSSVKGVFVSAFNTIKGVVQDVASAVRDLMNGIKNLPSSARKILGVQRGGFIPGMGSGDKIPALLEPGEFVMNRRAVSAYGIETMMRMNKSVPRFTSGGIIKPGRARALETKLAEAELTPGLADDLRAATSLRNAYRDSAAAIKRKLAIGGKNRVKGKKRQALLSQRLSDLQSQKTYEDMIVSLQGEMGSDSADLIQQQNALLQQQLQNQRDALNVSQSQYGVLVSALAAAVSGHIGGKVGLGMQAPAVAGRLASY